MLELIWQCESQRKSSVWSSGYTTLDAASPAENETVQNASRILSRLTDPVLRLRWHLRGPYVVGTLCFWFRVCKLTILCTTLVAHTI